MAILNAIYRPGLINNIEELIANKKAQGRFPITALSEILKDTYGILLYSETLLQILHNVVGMSYVDAMGCWNKIKRGDLEINFEFKEFFLKQCQENALLTNFEIKKLLQLIQANGQSCFLKAHSLCYSTIGYWGAYYKTYFREIFNKVFTKENSR